METRDETIDEELVIIDEEEYERFGITEQEETDDLNDNFIYNAF